MAHFAVSARQDVELCFVICYNLLLGLLKMIILATGTGGHNNSTKI